MDDDDDDESGSTKKSRIIGKRVSDKMNIETTYGVFD